MSMESFLFSRINSIRNKFLDFDYMLSSRAELGVTTKNLFSQFFNHKVAISEDTNIRRNT